MTIDGRRITNGIFVCDRTMDSASHFDDSDALRWTGASIACSGICAPVGFPDTYAVLTKMYLSPTVFANALPCVAMSVLSVCTARNSSSLNERFAARFQTTGQSARM